jgi:hypothetical protein
MFLFRPVTQTAPLWWWVAVYVTLAATAIQLVVRVVEAFA